MIYLDLDIFLLQLLPPHWRFVGKNNSGIYLLLQAFLTPLKTLLKALYEFRKNTIRTINLTAQPIVMENHIREITGLSRGISIVDDPSMLGSYRIDIPQEAQPYDKPIQAFLFALTPAGKLFTTHYY